MTSPTNHFAVFVQTDLPNGTHEWVRCGQLFWSRVEAEEAKARLESAFDGYAGKRAAYEVREMGE